MNTNYLQHFKIVQQRFDAALNACGYKGVIIHSGVARYIFLDDNPYPFKVNPYYNLWVPFTDAQNSFVIVEPGKKPQLLLLHPEDFWHSESTLPEGNWEQLFDIQIFKDGHDIIDHFANVDKDFAWLGESELIPKRHGFSNVLPNDLLSYLDYDRAYKTDWEIDNLRAANKLAGKAHLAAKIAFLNGASELEIHHEYLRTLNDEESNLPYRSIVALNEHGAILHYDRYERTAPSESKAFLIDAGARVNGYCADITRTWTRPEHTEFQAFIDRMDAEQLALIKEMRVGVDYTEYHYAMHQRLSQVLHDFDLISCSAQQALDDGLTKAFFPHGLGHLIGLNTHDIGGHQTSRKGPAEAPDDGHPFLRLRRPLEASMTVTIEPGCYVIDQLLRPHANHSGLNWERIKWLQSFGGIRIEDTILMTDQGAENLTRPFV